MRKLMILLLTAVLSGCAENPPVNDAGGFRQENVSEAAGNDSGQEGLRDETVNISHVQSASDDGYFFVYNNAEIRINEKAGQALSALGQYQDYFEAPSCAFDGVDKTYYYNGFEITTYPKGGEDYIFSIALVDDNNQTPEGIYLGSSVEELIEAYGEGYEKDMGLYVYEKGGMKLLFLTEDNVVVSITYELILSE